MAVEGWHIVADIGEDSELDLVGTQVSASASGGLYWYLNKAGITIANPPTTGQGWPR